MVVRTSLCRAIPGRHRCRTGAAGGGDAGLFRVFYWEAAPQHAVRLGDWKAYRAASEKLVELYNLAQYIGETKNLAASNSEIRKAMARSTNLLLVFLYYPMTLTHDPFQPTPDSPNLDPHVVRPKADQPAGNRKKARKENESGAAS